MDEPRLQLPAGYRPPLALAELEAAIKTIKDCFQAELAAGLGLQRVTAPLFVRAGTGLNDDLNGVERPVRFRVPAADEAEVELVQSLAKWKRWALARYGFGSGRGLYTDMNAVRPDEVLDNLHSIYVDQWDWEKIIEPAERCLDTLYTAVRRIYDALLRTGRRLAAAYPAIAVELPAAPVFISAAELAARYPDLTPAAREDRICVEHGAVFISGIGTPLAGGRPHDGRAPDYDDWRLNGDLLLWHPLLQRAVELSSMGIRVDAAGLRRQLAAAGAEQRAGLAFHRALLAGELPQTMGGGIGQSRLCMLLLGVAHIGEVAVGIWPEAMQRACAAANIFLL
jgi:aspartate--ammonia ligase